MRSPTRRVSEPPDEDAQRREPAGRDVAGDCGVCGGDVPPLIGQVLTGTGLTLAQAARRIEDGDELPALTPIQRRLVEEYAAAGGSR